MKRAAPLAMDAAEFRELGHALVDRIAGHLAALAAGPVTPGEAPSEVRAALCAEEPLPAEGADAGALLGRAADLLFRHSLFNGHPRFMGYITSSAAPIGMLADLLASAVNANVGGWKLSPMASEIEAQAVRWIAELLGYPAGSGGLLVSGGNMANFIGFLAARAAKAGRDVRKEGVAGSPLRVYASAETHTWIQKAADLFGLGTNAIRWIPTDAAQRIDLRALAAAIDDDERRGEQPFLVVGSAGTVSTGAVDPLPELAALCRERGLWFHVDGAYGAVAAAAPDGPPDLDGLAEADSVAVDPHKWLYAPLEAGCALVRDPEALRAAFSYSPPYYHFSGEEAINYFDYGMQNSRGFRALKVWLALQRAGRAGYARMVTEDMRLAGEAYRLFAAHPEFEAVTHNLSITTFRYVPPDLRAAEDAGYLNSLNQELLTRIERSGEVFLSNAWVDGRFLLRLCIVNFRTSQADIEALPGIVARHGREAHAALRQGAGEGA
jgi:aromatic-L-amino-acid decarboxylase